MVSQRVYYYCMVLLSTNKQATILVQLYTAAGPHVAITNFLRHCRPILLLNEDRFGMLSLFRRTDCKYKICKYELIILCLYHYLT